MYLSALILATFTIIAIIGWGACILFGKTVGIVLAILAAWLMYLALTTYTNKQEKLLYKELNALSPEERNEVILEAKEKGIIE